MRVPNRSTFEAALPLPTWSVLKVPDVIVDEQLSTRIWLPLPSKSMCWNVRFATDPANELRQAVPELELERVGKHVRVEVTVEVVTV